jgi:RNA polymerase-binding transcription factor DksA
VSTAKKTAPTKKATPAAKKAGAAKASSKAAAKSPAKAGTRATTKASTARTASKAAAGKATATRNTSKKAAKVTKATKAAKPLFDQKFLDVQRQALLDARAQYTKQADSLQAEADSLAELREPGDVQFDEESGEGDTLAVERERDLALSAQARDSVDDIDRALAKIDNGTYGVCEVSGQAIPKARLEAIPWARERVEYKVGGFGRR